jgi:hypothetical protein
MFILVQKSNTEANTFGWSTPLVVEAIERLSKVQVKDIVIAIVLFF